MSFEIRAKFRVDRNNFKLDVDLTLPGRGITALFGHSGSGKTTCSVAIVGPAPAVSAMRVKMPGTSCT